MTATRLWINPSFTPSGPRFCALVVDDEDCVRKFVRRALAAAGFEVIEATDGNAALELLDAGKFDVVVSDVDMPVMGGLELLRHLRRERPHLPVLLLSAPFEPGRGLPAADLGALALLQKPFSVEEIQCAVLHAVHPGSGLIARSPVLRR
jgi:CheY-like chemotaxis protein